MEVELTVNMFVSSQTIARGPLKVGSDMPFLRRQFLVQEFGDRESSRSLVARFRRDTFQAPTVLYLSKLCKKGVQEMQSSTW